MAGRTQTGRARRVAVGCAGLVVALALAAPAAQATLPGENGRIVFARADGTERTGGRGIFFVNPDGSGLDFGIIGGRSSQDPALSPDGKRIVYASLGFNYEITFYDLEARGSLFPELTDNTVDDTEPVFDPTETRIVFSSERELGGGCCDLVETDFDGAPQTKLTNTSNDEIAPDFSPDGATIAFSRDGEIWRMPADGSGTPAQLTTQGGRSPSFSPDGSRIAFASDRGNGDGNLDVYVMNADGSAETPLTSSPAYELEPSFSPDGTRIAFARGPSAAGGDIYLMSDDGSGVTGIVTGPEKVDSDPYWASLAASDYISADAEPGDADGDGTPDGADDLPLDPDETTDSDGDGIGDGADADDDGDGTPDARDAFPLDPAEDTDSDGDGVGDNSDPTPNGPAGGIGITCPAGTSPSVTCTRDRRGRTRFAGTGTAEAFVGTRGVDVVKAGGGKDVVRAKGGNDKLSGQGGRDTLKGQGGKDKLRGAGGRDRLSGGGGNDRINAKGQRRERVNCGGGNRDKVKGAKGDRVKRNCERVRR